MAEGTKAETKLVSAQDTGNPVLDSLVNICAGSRLVPTIADIEAIHETLMRLAPLEPGGLKRRRETVSSEPHETKRPTAEELQRRAR